MERFLTATYCSKTQDEMPEVKKTIGEKPPCPFPLEFTLADEAEVELANVCDVMRGHLLTDCSHLIPWDLRDRKNQWGEIKRQLHLHFRGQFRDPQFRLFVHKEVWYCDEFKVAKCLEELTDKISRRNRLIEGLRKQLSEENLN